MGANKSAFCCCTWNDSNPETGVHETELSKFAGYKNDSQNIEIRWPQSQEKAAPNKQPALLTAEADQTELRARSEKRLESEENGENQGDQDQKINLSYNQITKAEGLSLEAKRHYRSLNQLWGKRKLGYWVNSWNPLIIISKLRYNELNIMIYK